MNNENIAVHKPAELQDAYVYNGFLTLNFGSYVCHIEMNHGDSAYTIINNLRAGANNVAKEDGI